MNAALNRGKVALSVRKSALNSLESALNRVQVALISGSSNKCREISLTHQNKTA